jgi:redox-sensitive bicupin YhaK (pirin superfamily)
LGQSCKVSFITLALKTLLQSFKLFREFKMVEPSYQELVSFDIPSETISGVTVKVIAGSSMGIKSAVRTRTPTFYLDFKFSPGTKYTQEVPDGWTCFAYILGGKFRFGGKEGVDAHNTVLFNVDGDAVEMESVGQTEGHLVLIAGRPIGKDNRISMLCGYFIYFRRASCPTWTIRDEHQTGD